MFFFFSVFKHHVFRARSGRHGPGGEGLISQFPPPFENDMTGIQADKEEREKKEKKKEKRPSKNPPPYPDFSVSNPCAPVTGTLSG